MDGNATMILIFFLLDETGTGTDLGHKTVTFSFGNHRFVTAWIRTYFVSWIKTHTKKKAQDLDPHKRNKWHTEASAGTHGDVT